MKKNKVINVLKMLFVLLLFLVFGFCVYKFIEIKKEVSQVKEEQQELIEVAEIPVEPEESVEEQSKINFKELSSINQDVVGWISIEGTNMNYPIVQGKDNSYYLNHSFYKEYNKLGSIYMDATANEDFTSLNTFIYGHYTSSGDMFGELGKYMKQNFYNEHSKFYIYTPNQDYVVEVFSVHVDNASSNSYQMNFTTKEAYKEYIELMQKKSVIKSDFVVNPETDKIITLYSCSRETSYKKQDRYFVHGIIKKI